MYKPLNISREKYLKFLTNDDFRSRLPIRPSKQQNINDHEAPYLQHISWGPVGNSLAFVYNGDVYYSPSAKLKEIYRLSNSGSEMVSNGIPDWLYQGKFIVKF